MQAAEFESGTKCECYIAVEIRSTDDVDTSTNHLGHGERNNCAAERTAYIVRTVFNANASAQMFVLIWLVNACVVRIYRMRAVTELSGGQQKRL